MKDFVPYNESLQLKELGMDEPCIATYGELGQFELQDFEQSYDTFPSHIVSAPLFLQAFRWFREKYGVHLHPSKFDDTLWCVEYGDWSSDVFNSYEEAELACLRKLIDIARNKNN